MNTSNKLTLRLKAFENSLQGYIQQDHVLDVAKNVQSLFDRACEVKVTENLPSRQLDCFLAPSVRSLSDNPWNCKLFEKKIPLINPDLENPLKTFANIYKTHCEDAGGNPVPDNVFFLMLTEDKWSVTASRLQREVSNGVDRNNRRIIMSSALITFLLFISAYCFSNAFIALPGTFSLFVCGLFYLRSEI